MQMYCSNLEGWLWRADATEFYVQGPRTSKCCKLKVQNYFNFGIQNSIFGFTSGSSFTASARCCPAGVLVMRKYMEKQNTDGYTVILAFPIPFLSNIYDDTDGDHNYLWAIIQIYFYSSVATHTKIILYALPVATQCRQSCYARLCVYCEPAFSL